MEITHPEVGKLAQVVRSFMKAARTNLKETKTRQLVLEGNTGSGKTHALTRVHSILSRNWMDSMPYFRYTPAAVTIRWANASSADDTEWNYMFDEAKEASWIFIDDIGAGIDRFKNGLADSRLIQVLDAVERRNRWMMATTNIPRADWVKHFGDRIADRLQKSASVSLFNTPSFRRPKQ